VAAPFEPTPGGLARPRGKGRAAEGEAFGGLNPRSVTGMKQGRKVAGGRKRQEGEKPWRRSMTREWYPRGWSLPASEGAIGRQTLERRASSREGAQADSVILPRGAKAQEGSAASIIVDVAADAGRPRRACSQVQADGGAEPITALRSSERPPGGQATPQEEASAGRLVGNPESRQVSGGGTDGHRTLTYCCLL
jgi:hypothetical protein